MRSVYFSLLAVVMVLAAQPSFAVATFFVGSCKTTAFGSIGAAIAAAPAGSIIDVCPGTYAEQLVINKALTLQGIFSSNSSQAVITVPSSGLTTTSSINPGIVTVAAQVEVMAGPVNITNITVDGTTTSTNCPSTFFAGIFYSSGSSGTVNEVETRNQSCEGLDGIGILAENGPAASAASVKIENNNIHDNNFVGIEICSTQTPSTLTATVTGNYVGVNDGLGIISSCNAGGSISGNTVVANGIAEAGVLAGSPSTSVSGNVVSGVSIGIEVESTAAVSGNTVTGTTSAGIAVGAAGPVTSNHISNTPDGIVLNAPGTNVKTNTVTRTNVGIEFNCHMGTVTGNMINGAPTGLDQVPGAFTGANKFFNVVTTRTNGAC